MTGSPAATLFPRSTTTGSWRCSVNFALRSPPALGARSVTASSKARPVQPRTIPKERCMRIGLFIPCYIDAFFPEVGIATLELLERFGHEVVYPRDQTCCGQPMANTGLNAQCAATEALFVRNLRGFDYIVAPSGSCVHPVRDNFDAIEQPPQVTEVRKRTYE